MQTRKKNRLLLSENDFALRVHNAFLFPDADGPSMFPASVLVGVKISIFFRGHFVVQIIFLNLKATRDTVKTFASYPKQKHTTKLNFVLTELFVR